MRVFVTGASGRLGRPLVRALVAAGRSVVGLARSEAAATAISADGAAVARGDLMDEAALAQGLRGADLVIHLAGGLRGAGAVDAHRLNVDGTEALLRAALAAPQPPRLLFASSCAVYGDRSGLWVEEDMRLLPHTAYGHAKAEAEARVLAADALQPRVARIAAVYGAEFPFLQVERIQAGTAWLPGEGRNVVPTVHVDDAIAGLLRIAEAGAAGQIYNLADRAPVPLRELYAAVHAAVGGQPVRFWSTWIPSALQHRAATANERLAAALGRRPRFTPDALKLYTASSRLQTTRLERELSFVWRHPEPTAGVAQALAAVRRAP